MTKKLETLFEQTSEDQSRFGQLMYGTDWKMILIEKGSKAYFKNFNLFRPLQLSDLFHFEGLPNLR